MRPVSIKFYVLGFRLRVRKKANLCVTRYFESLRRT
jgi:hypothetical protein